MDRQLRRWLTAGMILLLAACTTTEPKPTDTNAANNIANDIAKNDASLVTLMDAMYQWTMDDSPEWATYRGEPGRNHRWSDVSLAGHIARGEAMKGFYQQLQTIERDGLSEEKQLDYDLIERQLRVNIDGLAFKQHLMPINQMGGVQQNIPRLLALMPKARRGDYDDRLARLAGAARVVDDTIAVLREGLSQGITPPRITLRDVPGQVRNIIPDDIDSSPLLGSFRQIPEEFDPDSLRADARTIVAEQVYPAFQRLLDFLEGEYIPNSVETIGLSNLQQGKDWYAHNIRVRTTTDMSAEEIHTLGLAEVKRIRAEMAKVIEASGFDGDFEAFSEFLRTDPQFYHTSAEDLLREYRDICKRADAELPKLFRTLPQTPYGVIAVPAYAEKSQTTAYYQGGSMEAGRAGMYYANTYALHTRPKWEMEALSLHEAVPGHHLQIALADELKGIHPMRRLVQPTAFVEGWGLYSESLGEAMGFYKDPYSKYGQLSYEMWRAVRLVVDTGMHAKGWSRQQAIDFFNANSAKQLHDITVEIDRYIVWPGQALAYKIGELKIKELRKRAEGKLGESFDIRAFHDEILGYGAIPLSIMEANIDRWIARQS